MTRYAGFWIRFVADLIDSIVLGVASWFVGVAVLAVFRAIGLVDTLSPVAEQVFEIGMYSVLSFPYYVWGHYRWGRTIGKVVVRVKVVNDPDLGPITLRQSIIRFFGYLLSAIPIWWGYVTAGWEPKKRAWHDLLAKTVSIRAVLAIALLAGAGAGVARADSKPPFTQLELAFLTSRPSAVGGEMGGALLFQPVTGHGLMIGPRLSVRGLSGSTGAIVGLQTGIEGNLWVANALGPGLAVDLVGPLREGETWQPVGWRVEGFTLARFKRHEKDGAWAGRIGATYDSRYHWGFLVGLSLQFSGVPDAYPGFLD